MGLDALVAALERDAEAAAAELMARATREAEAIRREVDLRVAREREARLREADRAHAAAAGARVATASRAAQLRILEAELAWLAGLRSAAEAALASLPPPRWRGAIPALVGTALRYAGPAAVTLRCPPAVQDAVWAVAGAREATTVTGEEGMPPGLVLTRDDGRLTVSLTVRDRLAVLWPDLQPRLLAGLEESA